MRAGRTSSTPQEGSSRADSRFSASPLVTASFTWPTDSSSEGHGSGKGQRSLRGQRAYLCRCALLTLVFVLHRVVGRVDHFLQLVPGQQVSAPLLLHSKQTLKVPDDDIIITIIILITLLGTPVLWNTQPYLSIRVWSTSESPAAGLTNEKLTCCRCPASTA
ncbi:hypothetical protein EYF80_058725 [Liparis tanakae]|uniref:Uncharacterized protein n=1 Tax=Liparis tanakae TaxID=230148 RepID=A0A4Z2ERX8_9TELE|nr:hypothetical protein EYF80_058725 [Liparis tanakae]